MCREAKRQGTEVRDCLRIPAVLLAWFISSLINSHECKPVAEGTGFLEWFLNDQYPLRVDVDIPCIRLFRVVLVAVMQISIGIFNTLWIDFKMLRLLKGIMDLNKAQARHLILS